MSLEGRTVLITGGARRIGRSLALAVARSGADVALHYHRSEGEAEAVRDEIIGMGRQAVLLRADLGDPQTCTDLIGRLRPRTDLFALVNNAAVFEALTWETTDPASWERHLTVNLTAPFLLSQAFARTLGDRAEGRIVNLLDWRALRPGPDHLPYTVSKAGLTALTRSLAVALAPRITVNGLALGAILPPQAGAPAGVLDRVPAGRWAGLEEVGQALLFLLDGPAYITGEILHVDGGRHLV
ncbi:MAG TPA: SDR family oxidoreductase [Anaerolineales bacterium]|nr:SDR family oxidoreductase [Anaerolineales bacterium]